MTADEELRDQLAETLWLSGRLMFDGDRYKAAAALLPVVRRHAEQRAAEELRAAAVDFGREDNGPGGALVALSLSARADALAATDTEVRRG